MGYLGSGYSTCPGTVREAAPIEGRDLLSFVLSTVSIVIAALTVLGAVIVVMTWNDIDERTGKIVAKYEQEAKTGIENYRQKKEAELDENARVHQEAIDHAGQQATSLVEDLQKKLTQIARRNQLFLGLIVVCLGYLWFRIIFKTDRWEKRLRQVEQSRRNKMG